MDPQSPRVNVADRLAEAAAERADAIAVAAADGRGGFRTITLGDLNADADTLARGMAAMGIGPGKRIALLVKPGIEFVTLVFALLRTGATMVLVDAGLGRKNLIRCLASTEPDGFVAIPLGHVVRVLKRKHFPTAKLNVTVGRRWFWGGETLASLRKLDEQKSPSPTGGGARGGGQRTVQENSSCNDGVSPSPNPSLQGRGISATLPHTTATDPAAIVFTSGSTGPPKGVLYTHQTFVTQCDEIRRQYDLRPGAVDLACFPLFGLFNVACGITTVLPEMDFSRPASCDPNKLIAAANQWRVTQAFGSPAVWDRLSRHCEETGHSIPTLQKVFSCGAPVPAKVLRRTLACVHPDAEMHTPYGATEALPVATIEAKEILGETAARTDEGAGVCVGRRFGSKAESGKGKAEASAREPSTSVGGGTTNDFDWRVIRISDDPIASIDDAEELLQGEIGELIVRGPQVSTRYLTGQPEASAPGSTDHNAAAKIVDGPLSEGTAVWHRMGDVGYFDAEQRFWYCGRKSHRVVTNEGTLYTECVEARVNAFASVRRSALVGLSEAPSQTPQLIVEIGYDLDEALDLMEDVLGHPDLEETSQGLIQKAIADSEDLRRLGPVLFHKELPTDIRHNSKIRREELAVWAEKQLRKQGR